MDGKTETQTTGIQSPGLAATAREEAKPRVQTAARTVSILVAVAQSQNGLKAMEISSSLRLPRQVTYHLLHTLCATGILRRNSDNRFVLGLSAAAIADGFRRQLAPPEHLAPRVRAAVASTGETAYAGGWVDGRIVVLATARGNSPVHAAEVPHGYSGHAHARAAGKLLLALAGPERRDDYFASNALAPLTRNTITTRERLDEELSRIARQGYAVDLEEFWDGLCCLAVPLEGSKSGFALGISVPAERFQANFDRYLAALRGVAGKEAAIEPVAAA